MTPLALDPGQLRQVRSMYRRHGAFIRHLLLRLGTPAPEVDDAAQEVFLVACRRLDSLHTPEAPRPWLCGIARRIAWRHRRTLERQHRRHGAFATLSNLDDPSALGAAEALQVVDGALARLPPALREAFVLSDLYGFTGPQVSEALGIKLATAYSRIRDARIAFRRVVIEDDSPEAHRRAMAVVMAARPVWASKPPAPPPLIPGGGSGFAKVFLTTVALGSVGLGVARVSLPSPTRNIPAVAAPTERVAHKAEARPSSSPEPTPPLNSAVANGPTVAPSLPAPSSSPPSHRQRRQAALGAPPAPESGSLKDESTVVRAALEALQRGDALRALHLLELADERFAGGPLTKERRRLMIEALCGLDRSAEAATVAGHPTPCDPGTPPHSRRPALSPH